MGEAPQSASASSIPTRMSPLLVPLPGLTGDIQALATPTG